MKYFTVFLSLVSLSAAAGDDFEFDLEVLAGHLTRQGRAAPLDTKSVVDLFQKPLDKHLKDTSPKKLEGLRQDVLKARGVRARRANEFFAILKDQKQERREAYVLSVIISLLY